MADEMLTGFLAGQADTNNNGGFFGNEGIWAVIILAIIFGWGNAGFGGFGGNSAGGQGGADTRAAISEGFALNGLENGVRSIQQGLCDGFYGMNSSLMSGFHGVDNAVCNLGFNTQQGFNAVTTAMMQGQNALSTQLANCCCENREAIAQVRYDMASQACDTRNTIQNTTRDIIDNQNANTRSILDFLVQDKISALQSENQALKFAASQANQNTYLAAMADAQTAELIRRLGPTPVPAYMVPAPYPYCVNNTGCGCGC